MTTNTPTTSAEDYASKLAALLGDGDPAELDARVQRALGVAHKTTTEEADAAIKAKVKAKKAKAPKRKR